jgi:hypothetical protein
MDFTNNENSILVYLPANLATRHHLRNWHEYSETAHVKQTYSTGKGTQNKAMNTAQINNCDA